MLVRHAVCSAFSRSEDRTDPLEGDLGHARRPRCVLRPLDATLDGFLDLVHDVGNCEAGA